MKTFGECDQIFVEQINDSAILLVASDEFLDIVCFVICQRHSRFDVRDWFSIWHQIIDCHQIFTDQGYSPGMRCKRSLKNSIKSSKQK